MITVILFCSISISWALMGLAMTAAPTLWRTWFSSILSDPMRRFLFAQGTLLAGLLLIVGATNHQGRWIWVCLGVLVAFTALVLLGLTESRQRALLETWSNRPLLAYRLIGVAFVSLATLLMIDTLRGAG